MYINHRRNLFFSHFPTPRFFVLHFPVSHFPPCISERVCAANFTLAFSACGVEAQVLLSGRRPIEVWFLWSWRILRVD